MKTTYKTFTNAFISLDMDVKSEVTGLNTTYRYELSIDDDPVIEEVVTKVGEEVPDATSVF